MLNYVIHKIWFLHSASLDPQECGRKDVCNELQCQVKCSFFAFPL